MTHRLEGPHTRRIEPWLRRIRLGDLRPASGALLLVTFALTPFQVLRIGPHVTLADVSLLLAGILCVVSCHRRLPIDAVVRGRLALGLALMAAGGLVGLLFAAPYSGGELSVQGHDVLSNFTRDNFSLSAASSAELLLRLSGVIVVCFLVIVGTEPSPRLLRRCLYLYVGASTVSAVLGSLASTTSLPLADLQNGVGRAVGLAGNANVFGVVTAIGTVFAASLAFMADRRIVRRVMVAAVVIQFVGLAYSGSRGAAIGVCVGLVVVALRMVRIGQVRPVVIGMAVVALGVTVAVLGVVRVPSVDRLLLRTDTPASARSIESTDVRIELLGRALDDRGLNSLVVGSGLREQPATSVHNSHFEVWLGLGMVGMVGWIIVVIVTVLPCLRLCLRPGPWNERESLQFTVSAAFLAFVVTALTVNNIWNRYLWLLVAVVALLHHRRAPGSRFPPTPERRRVVVTFLMTASFALMPLFGLRLTKVVSLADVPLVIAAFLVLIWGPFGRPPQRLLPPMLGWGAALLLVGSVTGLVFATSPFESAVLHGRLAATMVASWLIVAWWDPQWREVRRILRAFIAGAAVSAALGAIASITSFAFASAWHDNVGRSTGLAGNANHLGVFCALALVMACVLAVHEQAWRVYCVAMVPLVAAMMWSGSRSGVVAALVALAFLAVHVVLMGRSRVVLVLGVSIGLVFLLGFLGVVRIPLIDRALLRTDTGPSQFAVLSTDTRIELAKERLDEVGGWALVVGDGMVNRSTTGPHSGHLEIWVGLGAIGFVGWGLVCLSTVRPVFGLTWSRQRHRARPLLLYAVTLSFVTHIVLAVFLEHIWTRYVWLLVGLSAVLSTPDQPLVEEEASRGRAVEIQG